jgi:ABC-type amino acid transport substrate-binding protein
MRDFVSNLEEIRESELSIAMVGSDYFEGGVHQVLPNAEIVVLDSAEAFFTDDSHGAEVLILSAEEGAAYTYRYPRYTVVRTRRSVKIPASYAIPKGDFEMVDFINNWIALKRSDGTIDQLYQYWMLGGVTEKKEPRWSIVRDVLHWID